MKNIATRKVNYLQNKHNILLNVIMRLKYIMEKIQLNK